MKEQLITFETAKLAKEKGFPQLEFHVIGKDDYYIDFETIGSALYNKNSNFGTETKQYDITSGTLRRWAEAGKIRCLRPNGGKRI